MTVLFGLPDANSSSLWLRGNDGDASLEVISESDFEVFIDIFYYSIISENQKRASRQYHDALVRFEEKKVTNTKTERCC